MTDATGKKRFRMTAYTGQPVDLGHFWGRVVFDVSGISAKDKLPALREHETDRIVGTIDKTLKTGTHIFADGFFLATKDGLECSYLVEDGFPMQCSVGLATQKVEEISNGESSQVNGFEFSGPGLIIRESRLLEVSFCSLGADSETSVSLAASILKGDHAMRDHPKTFEAAIAKFMADGKSRTDAIRAAVRNYPNLHEEYIDRTNREWERSGQR
jgi:hypothetical protein